jgi:transmembrane sensor
VVRAAAWSTAVAGLAALALTLYWAMPERNVYVTATGEHRTFVLPDRSSMTLNTGSRARIVYERGTRNVYLDRGEATFAVVKDPSRPFAVHAVGVVAKAVGTEFNVYSANGGVTVAVLSGKVLVTAHRADQPAGRALVAGGQEVTYAQTRLSNIGRANLKRIEAWHSGRIAFEDIGLAAAVAEFNRYGMTPIELGDPSLASLRVSGVFRVGEQEALLRALTHAFGLHVERTSTAIVLRAGEPARSEVLDPTAEI